MTNPKTKTTMISRFNYIIFAACLCAALYTTKERQLNRIQRLEMKKDTTEATRKPLVGQNLYYYQTIRINGEKIKRKVYIKRHTMQTKMYFNTTNLQDEELRAAVSAAKTQNDKIEVFFRNNPGVGFSPSKVWAALFDEKTPITSVRRSMTVLTRRGILEKTDTKFPGQYGRPEYKWKLK